MHRKAKVSNSSRSSSCVRSVLSTAIVGALLLGSVLPAAAQQQPAYQETGQSGDADSWRSDEFKADWGLTAIGAHHAYARGLTGRGIRLGILDSGVDLGHGEFSGRSHNGIRIADILADGTLCANTTDLAGPNACFMSDGGTVGVDYFHYTDEDRELVAYLTSIGYFYDWVPEYLESLAGFSYSTHGTHVAGTMAANRDGNGSHGVAFGADLTSARLFSNSYLDLYALLGAGGDSFSIGPDTSAIDSMYDQMAAQGVRAINHSWGLSSEPTTAAGMDALYNAPGVADYLATFTDPSLRDHVIQVWAAGNASGDIAGLYASLPRWTPEVEKYWLSVVNINQGGGIDRSSSICGLSANWCLAAPGTDITSSVVGGDIDGEVVYDADGNVVGIDVTSENPAYGHGDLTGTSMAAPHVTGALALLMERYPYLYNDQIRDVLLTTARDLGAAGVDEIYGWGLMDLEKAIEGYAQFRVDTNVVMNRRAGGTKVWEGMAWDDWTNDIGGPGRLTKSGLGWLRLSGDNSFAGATIAQGILELDGDNALSGNVEVTGGHLFLNGSLTDTDLVVTNGSALVLGSQNGGATYVGAAGRLAGTGTLSTTTVAGTVAPGASIGTLNINGDYTQLAGSTYEAQLGLQGVSDRLAITGNANLGGTLQFLQGGASSMLLGERYNILSAAAVLGQFGAVDTSAFSPFLAFNINYGATQVMVDVVRGQLLASAAQTFNQRAVAGAIDASPMNHRITQVLTQLFPEQALPALDSLSGELHASARSVMVDSQRHVRGVALDRAQAGQGAFAPANAGAGASAWVDVSRHGGALNSDGNAGRVDYNGNDTLVGADYRFDGGLRVGVLGGAGRTDMDVMARGTDGDITSRHLGIYAGQAWGGFGLRAGVSHAQSEIDVQRIVDMPGLQDRTHVEYDARTTQAFVEGGYRFAAGAWEIEPYAQFAQVRVDTDGFRETGGITALQGSDADNRVDLATAGLRFNVNLRGAQQAADWLSLRGGVGYRDASGDLLPAATVAWNDGIAFTVLGAPLADDATLVNLGLGARLGTSSLLEFGYSGQLADEARDHGVNARFSVQF
ncbi:MAG: S8 family serine peptidase [Pseudomonadota bacterium]|nr:S8 family serine peptidase [Pseudomonadota bacterium]